MENTRLVARILARDERALYEFYQTYTPRLKKLIHAKVQNPHDAEDILQDTMYAFLDAIRDFQGNAKLTTFLQSICNHKIIDYYRKKRVKQVVFSQFPELETIVSPLMGPEETYDAHTIKEELHKTLNKLIPQYKMVLYARYILNMPVAEIAGKLEITLKSAESMLFRAKKAFVKNHGRI